MKRIKKTIQVKPADELRKQGFVRLWWLCPMPIDATLIEARTLMRALPGECVWILPSASVNPKSYHFKSPYLWLDIREILPLAKFLAHGTLYASIKKIINMSKEEFLALKVILQISDANKTEAIV